MTIELTLANALAYQSYGDAAMAEAQRLTKAANDLLRRAEAHSNSALRYWSRAQAITLALDYIAEQNSEK